MYLQIQSFYNQIFGFFSKKEKEKENGWTIITYEVVMWWSPHNSQVLNAYKMGGITCASSRGALYVC